MKKSLSIVALTLVFVFGAGRFALAQGGDVHYVQPGETLASIAAGYNVSLEAIMAANGLNDPDYIYAGQKLNLPGRAGGSLGGSYIVKPGDTLSRIAWQFGVTVQALAAANNLTSVDTIYAGQVLNVPGGGPGEYAPPQTYKCGSYYTIKWGDTASGIAWSHGIAVSALLQANNLAGEAIYAGQKLCVPGIFKPAPMVAFYHTVQAGDTVTSIAYRYGTTPAAIIQANNLANSGLIYVGQKLSVPDYRPAQPAPALATGVPPAPGYVDVSQQAKPAWDGTVMVVKAGNKWQGSQTADIPDPNGITTMIVRIVGADNIPVAIKQGDLVWRGTVGTSAEFGLASFGFRGLPPGDYEVWVDQDKSEVVKASVMSGRRGLVEFRYVSVSEDPISRSSTGWTGRVAKNSSGTTDANGVWSVIIVKASAIGLPISIRSQGNDFTATCYTGTKPEYGPAACDFGGLWPGLYTLTLEGAGISVEVFVDGQGVAEVVFDNK